MPRPTREGWALMGLMGLTLFAALASGNNLLYLLYSLMLSAGLISLLALRGTLKRVKVEVKTAGTVFAGEPTRLCLKARNEGQNSVYGLRLRGVLIEKLAPGETREVLFKTELPHRGINSLPGLALTCDFPFGLLRARIELPPLLVLAYPRPRKVRSSKELEADVTEAGVLRPKRGVGDELYSVREFTETDEPRTINWKQSARKGELLVNEFADREGSRITVRLPPGASEHAIGEAASAVKHHIDKGAEVALKADGLEIGHGRGFLHLDRLLKGLALLGPGARPRPVAREDFEKDAPAPRALLPLNHAGAFLIFTGLFLIEELPPLFLWSLTPVLPLSWWLDAKMKGRPPQWLWNLASVSVLAYVLLFAWKALGVTLANTHLLLYILVNRLLSPKESKDIRQLFFILFLAFFLISGQTISLWYFALFLAYAAFAMAWLMTRSAGGVVLPKTQAAGLAAVVLLAASMGFAATPRLEPLKRMNPFIAMGLDKRAPKSEFVVAFTEDVSLGFFGRLKKSSARVLRLKPLNFTPPASLRVRGAALDRFTGRRWLKTRPDFRYRIGGTLYKTREGKAWAQPQRGELIFPGGKAGEGPLQYEVTLLPLDSQVLFTLGGVRRLQAEQLQAAYIDASDSAYFGSKLLAGLRYQAWTDPKSRSGYGAHIENYDRLRDELFLQLPKDLDPRIKDLALRLTRNAKTPAEKIRAVVDYLTRGYGYSTYSDDADKDLSSFLFQSHTGNCEYFATAAAVLLRASGMPTRLITGFLAEDWNEFGGFFDVRQGQAHAWIEAWTPEAGWVEVDPTPPADSLASRTTAVFERARRWFDAAQFRWYRHIIGYDRFSQKDTFHRFRMSLDDPRLRAGADRFLKMMGGGLAAGGIVWGLWTLAGLRRTRTDGPYQKAKTLLRRRGLEPRRGETPREFAARAAADLPEAAPLRDLVEAHYAERYGKRPEAEAAGRLLEELEERLTSTGRWPRFRC